MKSRLVILLPIFWMLVVYAIHYGTYYGPRLARFFQQWITR